MDVGLSDRYARIGFWVPAALAVVATIVAVATTWDDTSGYGGLVFIFFLIVGVPAILVWLAIGALVARAKGPPGAARQFAVGAGLALALTILLLSGSCFASYAV